MKNAMKSVKLICNMQLFVFSRIVYTYVYNNIIIKYTEFLENKIMGLYYKAAIYYINKNNILYKYG